MTAAAVQEMLLQTLQQIAIKDGMAELSDVQDEYGDYHYFGAFWINEGMLDGPIETPEGIWKEIESGRDRDEPSTYYHIYELSQNDSSRFFRITGYYDSWQGTEYEDPDLVEVTKKTRIEEYWD